MSNQFGPYYYRKAADGIGFDIFKIGNTEGAIDWEDTPPMAIMNCQRRYIRELESTTALVRDLAEPLRYAIRDDPPAKMSSLSFLLAEGVLWANNKGDALRIAHLNLLLGAIYNDAPELKLRNSVKQPDD